MGGLGLGLMEEKEGMVLWVVREAQGVNIRTNISTLLNPLRTIVTNT